MNSRCTPAAPRASGAPLQAPEFRGLPRFVLVLLLLQVGLIACITLT